MKIHDKFVIELAEIIKGYGNDYRVEEPFHLPRDYKFYEISGVAICEESVKKMKPLTEEVNSVLDKIRAEIDGKYRVILKDTPKDDWAVRWNDCLDEVLKIIDKYKESEE